MEQGTILLSRADKPNTISDTVDLLTVESRLQDLQHQRLRGDHDLNPGTGPADTHSPAAVLVLLVNRAEGPTVLLTQRTEHLHHHAGQISFPGGRLETCDGPPDTIDAHIAAALRETREEIGLAEQSIRILGRLDTYITRTGFRVTPIVGSIEPPFELRLDAFEVAEAFEVPLTFFLDERNHQREVRDFGGSAKTFFAMSYESRFIWGATAGMIRNLFEIFNDPNNAPRLRP